MREKNSRGVEEKRSDFMNNKVAKAGMAVGIFLGVAVFYEELYHFFHSETNIPI